MHSVWKFLRTAIVPAAVAGIATLPLAILRLASRRTRLTLAPGSRVKKMFCQYCS
jgi:hypothetical protein